MKMAKKSKSPSISKVKPKVSEAKKFLTQAIKLHEKHMDGKAPVTGKAGEKSQMQMMTMMEKAKKALT